MTERFLRMTTGTPIRLVQFFILPPKNTFKYRSPFHQRARKYSARAERSEVFFGMPGGDQSEIEILESECICSRVLQRLDFSASSNFV